MTLCTMFSLCFGVPGVVTKAAVAHPHKAGKDIGVLALKRTKIMMIL